MNTTAQSVTDENSAHPESSRVHVLLTFLYACFWFGNLVIAAPSIAEMLAAKVSPLFADFGQSAAELSLPRWLVLAISIMLATQVVAITAAMGLLESFMGPPAGNGQASDGSPAFWKQVFVVISRPSVVWLLCLCLAYLSLSVRDNERSNAIEGQFSALQETTNVIGFPEIAQPAEAPKSQQPSAQFNELLPSPWTLSYWLLSFLAGIILITQIRLNSSDRRTASESLSEEQ